MTRGSRIPYDVQCDVAEDFWEYLQTLGSMPETKTALRLLYLETFRPFLQDPEEKRVNFSSLFYCLKYCGFLQTDTEDKERIIYSSTRTSPAASPSSVETTSIEREMHSPPIKNDSRPKAKKKRRRRKKKGRKQDANSSFEEQGSVEDNSPVSLLDLAEVREQLVTQRHHVVTDKGDVTILPASDENGTIDLGTINRNEPGKLEFDIRNECERDLIFGYTVLNLDDNNASYKATVETEENRLDGFEQISVPVEICANSLGVFQVSLVFCFQCGQEKPFYIVKFVQIKVVENSMEHDKDVLSDNNLCDLDKVMAKLTTNRGHLVKDKGHVTIYPTSNPEGVIDFGVMHVGANNSKSFQIHVNNNGNKNFVFGYNVLKSVCDCYEDTTTYKVTAESVDDQLNIQQMITVPIDIQANNPGIFHVPLVFRFQSKKEEPFYIVKFIKVEILAEDSALTSEAREEDTKAREEDSQGRGEEETGARGETGARDDETGVRDDETEARDDETRARDDETGQPSTSEAKGEDTESRQEETSHPPIPEANEDFVDIADLRKKLVTNRLHLAKDKGEIVILPASNNDGVIDMGTLDISVSKRFQIHIRNKNNKEVNFGYIVLGSSCDFTVGSTNYKLLDETVANELGPFECIPIDVDIKANNPGIFNMTLAFWFKFASNKPFTIVKFIKMELSDNVVNDLQPVSPYVKPKFVPRSSEYCEVVRGVPPEFSGNTQVAIKLDQYLTPNDLKSCAKSRTLDDCLTKIFQGNLSATNHYKRFSNLLHAEEMQMKEDIRRYDMDKVHLRRVQLVKDMLSLSVPGLSENRPSLVCGDRLHVHKHKANGQKEDKLYEGFVHAVHMNEVYLKFAPVFHKSFVDGMSFSVEFTFNRTPLKMMHRALKMSSDFIRQLPWNESQPQCVSITAKTKELRFYDQNIANNNEQKQAVENIVAGTSRPYPYLVFGPPGSGKTVTLVEAIKQVLKNSPKTKVLACAPSNSAADLILERVSQHNVLPNAQMVRLNAYGRVAAIDPKLMKFCKKGRGGFFYFPPPEEIMTKYRLVVTTLISAGRLVSMGVGQSHFTHVFIDEAGHGMEPESLVAIAGLHNPNRKKGGQLVLAGDPKQLGPVLRSPEAIKFGLNMSLLERLMATQFPCYDRQPGKKKRNVGYNEKLVTKLLNNYRSHPAIIKLPNEMFYHNELRACADQLVRESLCQWTGLKKKGFPVLFEGVSGKDQREEKSPSFFNSQEVSVVLRYVRELKEARGVSVKTEEIGIISPYHRQVQKIRQSLQKKPYNINDIKVGSVEEFQGQERKVIIISTVRSSEDFLHIDAVHKLGFLKNPKRFNVAITRAKALLIVIGNPRVLCRDTYWRRLIQYCMDNGSYQGCVFKMPEVDDEELASQLAKLGLNDEDAFQPKGDNTYYEDKEWKLGDV